MKRELHVTGQNTEKNLNFFSRRGLIVAPSSSNRTPTPSCRIADGLIQSKEYTDRFGNKAIPGHPRVHYQFVAGQIGATGRSLPRTNSSRSSPAGTPQSTQVKDLLLFPAALLEWGIRNNGSVCHIAVISWSSTGQIKRYRVPAGSEIIVKVEGVTGKAQLIGEEPCE